MVPPAFSMAARADLDAGIPFTVSFFVSVPSPTILTGALERAWMTPRSCSVFVETSAPESNAVSRRPSDIVTASCRELSTVRPRFFPKPLRFGSFLMMSRHSGRFLRPARAFCPLVPRPEVLPRLPPRPTRRFARLVSRFSSCRLVILVVRGLYLRRRSAFRERSRRLLQGLDSRARVVDRILAAREEFCGHIGHAAEFENGPDRRAGDQPPAGGGPDLHARGAEFCRHIVQDAPVLGEVDRYHGPLRGARGLLDGERGVGGFAKAYPHAALLVAQHKRGAEVEAATAGHDTRHAPDADQFLREFTSAFVARTISPRTPARATAAAARVA